MPSPGLRVGMVLSCALAVAAGTRPAMADRQTTTAPLSAPEQTVSASAALDFNINIGKFIFFRVGSGAFPVASGTVDTVTLDTSASFPASVTNGTAMPLSWDGSVPLFASTANATLPVEVRSNAGQIALRTTVVSPLSNGSASIPFSAIHIVSSDSNLPAPPVPDSGTGAAVNVTGTAFANLVTERVADWTFSYADSSDSTAGSYTGVLMFTASAL